METLLLALLGIILLFFIGLGIHALLPLLLQKRVCVLCAAVAATWIGLLILFYRGVFDDVRIIALLMGQTLLGIFFLVESKVRRRFTLFRLPFFLILTITGYWLLSPHSFPTAAAWLVAAVWLLFLMLYWSYRYRKKGKAVIMKIIACCKKW